jgi:hypothetical protein
LHLHAGSEIDLFIVIGKMVSWRPENCNIFLMEKTLSKKRGKKLVINSGIFFGLGVGAQASCPEVGRRRATRARLSSFGSVRDRERK